MSALGESNCAHQSSPSSSSSITTITIISTTTTTTTTTMVDHLVDGPDAAELLAGPVGDLVVQPHQTQGMTNMQE